MKPTQKELEAMPLEKLRRKATQHWGMAGLARQDCDSADEQKQTALARAYETAIAERKAVSNDLG